MNHDLFKTDFAAAVREFMDNEVGSLNELFDYMHKPKIIGGVTLECVESEGGHEGEGEHASRVLSFTVNHQLMGYARFTGSYSSYEGTEWDSEFTVVHPRQTITTEYLAVDGSEDHHHKFLEVSNPQA